MSANLEAIHAAIVERLGGIDANVTVYDDPPHAPVQLPCLLVYFPDSINYRRTRAIDVVTVPILLLVGPQDPTAVKVLRAFASGTGALSVLAALYSDRTLGGVASNLRLLDMTSGAYSVGTGPDDNAIGAEFRVEIHA